MPLTAINDSSSAHALNMAQQAVVTCGKRVYNLFQNRYIAGTTLIISTLIGSAFAAVVGMKIYERFFTGEGSLPRDVRESKWRIARTNTLLFGPLTLIVGGINWGVSKLLNLPFPTVITVPLSMTIFVLVVRHILSQCGQGG